MEQKGEHVLQASWVPHWVVNCADGVFGVDTEGRILVWNTAAQRVLGFSAEEVAGRPCWEVLRGTAEGEEVMCHPDCPVLRTARRGGLVPSYVLVARHKSGTPVPLSVSIMMAQRRHAGHLPEVVVHLLRPLETRAAQSEGAGARAGARPVLELRLLGVFEALRYGEPIPRREWRRPRAKDLLKYLVTHRQRWVPREEVAEALWPNLGPEEGLHNLRVVLSYLRHALETGVRHPAASSYLRTEHQVLRFMEGPTVWIDIAEFEAKSQVARTHPERFLNEQEVQSLQEAVELYRGELLEDNPYDDWAAWERTRFRNMYLDCLNRLAAHYTRQGFHEQAIPYRQRAIAADPLNEAYHRALVQDYLAAGHPGQALRQLETLRSHVGQELDAGLEPATQLLYQQVLRRVHQTGAVRLRASPREHPLR